MFNGAMFEKSYLDRAMEMMKTGTQFFWEPVGAWYFAAQREYTEERYTKTIFRVQPVFFETRMELWPQEFRVTAMRFKQPYPNMIMLYHQEKCVWNRAVAKPRDPVTNEVLMDSVVKIDFASFLREPIVTIQGIDPSLCKRLAHNWAQRAKKI